MNPVGKANSVIAEARNRLQANRAKRDFKHSRTDLVGAFEFARDYRRGQVDLQISGMQIESEIIAFLSLIQERQSKSIVEIGTAFGGSLFLLTRAAAPNARIVSVGMPGEFGGGRFGGSYPPWQAVILRSFARENQIIRLVRGDSHDPQTVAAVAAELEGEADVLFIDGDHTLSGVQADFQNYRSLIHAGGLIAFHDIVPGPPDAVGGVPDFWAATKSGFDHVEFVEDWQQGGYGIGVLKI